MKKKILLTLAMVLVLSLVLAFTVFAEETSVHNGKVDLSATVTLDDGTECALFDSEGNALIWFKNGSELQSIRADDPRVKYKATYQFNVGNKTVGSVTAYEVSDMWIALESGNVSKGNIVVLNLMDDDVLVNEASNSAYLNKPVNCLKGIAWANKVIEYAFCRLDTVALQQQAFCGCPKLKYINLEDLTELRQFGGSQTFGVSENLFKGETLDLTGTKLVAFAGDGAFNGVPVADFKLPKTLTSVNPWCFQGTALTVFAFPENVTKINGSQFKNCASLTTIYLNNKVTEISDSAFKPENKQIPLEKVFFAGSLAELNALLNNTSTSNNKPFWDVVGENRANLISYKDYLELEDKSGKYVVYDYSYCEAFAEGEHTFTGNATMQKIDYFKGVFFSDTCTVQNCGMNVVDESKTIGAMFIDYGYSATEEAINGVYSMSQFYGINKGAIEQYKALGVEFEFGFVVAANADPFGAIENGELSADKVFVTEEKFFGFDYVSVSVSGITAASADKSVAFCMFVKNNGEVSYLDKGETVESVTMKSYNDILTMIK